MLYILFSGFIISSIILIIVMVINVTKTLQSRHWLAAKAIVLKSELKCNKNEV